MKKINLGNPRTLRYLALNVKLEKFDSWNDSDISTRCARSCSQDGFPECQT